MLQRTHSAAGIVAAELVIITQDISFLSWEAAGAVLIGCLAGPLADIDKPGSIAAKIWFPLSALLRLIGVRHRTMTHSILFIAALMSLAAPLPELFFWTFIAAYATHPLIDLLNERGVQLLWPIKWRIRLLPGWLAVDTGSLGETIFRWVLIGVSLWLPFYTILPT